VGATNRPTGDRLTYRDLDLCPDDGNRYEVIDGILHVTPFPSYAHQRAQSKLFTALAAHIEANDLGELFSAGLKVVLDEPSGVGPDLVYISHARLAQMHDDGFYGAPDLVVEILSSKPGLDRVVKKHKYAHAGVPCYWIIDPDARQLEAYRLRGDVYELEAELTGSASFQPEVFPGLAIDLGRLWA
jgi:Uma2 family endonuclease